MNNFWQRTITGIAFVVILIGCIWAHEYSFFSLFILITIFASKEFYQIIEKNANIQLNKTGAIVASALLFIAGFFSAKYFFSTNIFFLIYFLFIIGLIISELYRKKENPVHNWAYLILGQFFVALPFSLLNLLVFPSWEGNYYSIFLLSLFILIWVNDTGAYLFGVSFGKHKLFERISPKKSWEGFIGGIVCTLAFSILLSEITNTMDIYRWLGFGAIIVAFGTWGDLTESLMKRTLNIKDSGNILPGHGGLLDRFDSMLLAAPVIVIYLQIVL